MNALTFPLPLLRHYLRDLLRQPSHTLRCPVGVSRHEDNVELIAASPRSGIERTLLLRLTDDLASSPLLPADCTGVLLLGRAQQRGHARGFLQLAPDQLEPLHTLRLIGPGMFTVPLTDSPLHPFTPSLLHDRWSRTIGALGSDAYQRLINLRCALIGVGRTGSSLALALARLGVSHLTLIDPDTLEPHNLGETEAVTAADLGKPKAEAVAAHCMGVWAYGRMDEDIVRPHAHTPTRPHAVVASITHLRALHAAQACDVLFCCADHDSARLAAATIAALFCKPLIDIATGIFQIPNPNDQIPNPTHPFTPSPLHPFSRLMGADVRLVLPAETCLLCLGGLRNEEEARHTLASADAERAVYARRDWRRERAGSLASLNRLAVSVALRLYEDFISERVRTSTWIHAEFDDAGRLTVTYPTTHHSPLTTHQPTCRLCALTGWGEGGLRRVAEIFGMSR